MKKILIIITIATLISGLGCKKYLDANPDKSEVLTTDNVTNLQLLLNDAFTLNEFVPSAGEVGTDNMLIPDALFQSFQSTYQTASNLYIYNTNVFNEAKEKTLNDWNNSYQAIFSANVVLDAVGKVPGGTSTATGINVRGQALFYRAFYFYGLLQDFAKPYITSSAAGDAGIVLRLTSDISVTSKRSSVQDCYNQVINDLQQAIPLLPVKQSYATTPNKAAALGLLARTYLAMSDYDDALIYAKQYLAISPTLLDYNTLSTSAAYPIAKYNQEVNFQACLFSFGPYTTKYGRIADSLFMSYDFNDLRKKIFFTNGGTGNVTFKGSYFGNSQLFGGIATDEVYLIAAESYARTSDVSNAMSTLNQLLQNRYQSGTFTPFYASNQNDAIQQILEERRKELVFRNLRWTDLRRLNLDPATQTTVTHTVNGATYTLLPNDSHYVLKIPDEVIQLAGIAQN